MHSGLALGNLQLSQFLNDYIHVNELWVLVELIATIEIDMLPCNWGNLLQHIRTALAAESAKAKN